jgi:hypothetical protein
MTAGDWAAVIVGIAGVVAALGAVSSRTARTPLIITCASLICLALIIGFFSLPLGPNRGPSSPQPAEPTSSPTAPDASGSSGSMFPSVVPLSPANPSFGQTAVRHEGSITIASNTLYDLDSTDPQWGQTHTSGYGSDMRAYGYDNVDLGIERGAQYLILSASSPSSYDLCRQATGYRSGTINDVKHSSLKTGMKICIITNEGRYSLIGIQGVQSDSFMIAATTWEK